MSSKQELTLFAGLGILGFCIIKTVHTQLLTVRKACEITQPQASNFYPKGRTEDALKLLSRNANEDIRNAAINIITERACKGPSCKLILRDLGGKNRERRYRALTTMTYLTKYHFSSETICFDAYKHETVQSIIDCLSNLLPLSYQYEIARMKDQLSYRTQPELDALELLKFFLGRFGVGIGLECNLFSQWLAKYPFGGDLESKYPGNKAAQIFTKQKAVEKVYSLRDNDLAMAQVLRLIRTDAKACEMMSDCRLLIEVYPHGGGEDENSDDDGYGQVWYEIHGTATAPDPGLGPMMRRGQRVREESLEEQALRSRRREAMVLGEMGRPIERENIIQRVNT